jgi:tetratricopeptide (TPR) repeat protein
MSDPGAHGLSKALRNIRAAAERLYEQFAIRIADPVINRFLPMVGSTTRKVLHGTMLLLLVTPILAGGSYAVWLWFKPDTRIVIVVAAPAGDERSVWQARIVEALHNGLGNRVIVRRVSDVLPPESDLRGKTREIARSGAAQAIIQREHGNVIVWGQVSRSGHSAQLFFLPWDGTSDASHVHRYLLRDALQILKDPDRGTDLAVSVIAARMARSREGTTINLAPLIGPIETSAADILRSASLDGARRGIALRAYALAIAAHAGAIGDRALFKKAIDAFRQAQLYTSPVASPFDWISLRANLAAALERVGDQEGPSYTHEALVARKQVLSFYDEKVSPLDWAAATQAVADTYNSLAFALGDKDSEHTAIDTSRTVLNEFTREETPLDWADTQYAIAGDLRRLSYMSDDTSPLADARAALDLALKEMTRERVPLDWAGCEDEMATVTRMLAESSKDLKLLADALAHDAAALEIFTRKNRPQAWASVQIGVGNTYSDRGRTTKDPKDFDQAIAAYRQALEVYTENYPSDHALALYDLGLALEDYGVIKKDAKLLKDAIMAQSQAIAINDKYGFSGGANDSRSARQNAINELKSLTGG